MSGFRSHDSQFSDRMPIRRSLEEKKRVLIQLRDQQAGLKPWVSTEVKTSLARRIAELEKEIAGGTRRDLA
jgi:hypothetical protein